MPVITSEASRAFVARASLPAPPSRTRRAPAQPRNLNESEAQALVVGSSLIVAAEGVPLQTRKDLIDCTLFAQLAASGAVADPKNVAAWYAVYFQALTAVGFAQHDSRFEEFESRATSIEAHKSVIKVLTTLLGPTAAAVTLVSDTFKALQEINENQPWISLFDRESVAVRSARFQVATAQPESNGQINLALVAFDLWSKASVSQVLFFKFKSGSTRLKFARGNATIYEAVLAKNRTSVAERLDAYRSAYIGAVKFPSRPV